jgi:hypothetical protein
LTFSGPLSTFLLLLALCSKDVSTISAELEVEDVAHAAVDDAKEALILFLELSLIEYLYGDDARLFYGSCTVNIMAVSWGGLHIE